MEMVMLVFEVVRRLLQKAGPYVALEIVLPGGTLVAVALFVYRRRESFWRPLSNRRPADRL
jgi:hypothetical protein